MKSFLVLMALVALLFIGTVAGQRVLYDRQAAPADWSVAGMAKMTDSVEFTLALKQRNLDILDKWFTEASDPTHHNYQSFKSIDEINDLVSPTPAQINSIKRWLRRSGVKKADIKHLGDAINVKTNVASAQRLFRTEFRSYAHVQTGYKIVRQFGEYSVPADVSDLVEMVAGLSTFPIPHLSIQGRETPVNGDGVVVPETLIAQYGIPPTAPAKKNKKVQLNGAVANANSQAVIEFEGQYFAPSDLTAFGNGTDRDVQAVPASQIVGTNDATNPGDESSLDIQMVAGVNLGGSNWFWIESGNGWLYTFSNSFFNTASVPLVNSISYGWWEGDQCDSGIDNTTCIQLGINSVQYVQRVNTEFQKIGLRGVSLIASAGDSGANGRTNPDCTVPQLRPAYPASSPYVTAVGATEIVNFQNLANPPPVCATFSSQSLPCIQSGTEEAVSYAISQFASGGGFSNISSMPSYQQTVVQAYLNSGVTLPPASYFNASGRGHPDVAAVGHNLVTYISGSPQPVGGTSASSPIFASIMAILNEAQIKNTGKPLGFLNPFLYQMQAAQPSTFTDITVGDNICTEDGCGASCKGFLASKGWDPVTGLGTPNAQVMLDYVNKQTFMTKKH